MIRKVLFPFLTLALAAGLVTSAAAEEYRIAIQKLVESDMRGWIQSEQVVTAIREQNKTSATLNQSDIDRQDKAWRAETENGDQKMINAVLGNALSAYLRDVQSKSGGLYTEIFVMDMKGLNVGQSNITSDYWQGDEAKWQDTYGGGASALLIDEVDFDDSSQAYQSQVSLAVIDPANDEIIGAITVGVNVDMLD
ncbi:MAG: hypothetical protein CMN55_03635 [Sneathiella sp.]|jgi:hypothetical protein|uniref:hypothetical protein n=1 Tax=Sneathiella sp. TaxID=1964365 RepID=UPI000C554C5B|nr:hypothetical protein [Sneathiella sp.]MAL78195.1 hypothetical protein [Sneathiella sp.]